MYVGLSCTGGAEGRSVPPLCCSKMFVWVFCSFPLEVADMHVEDKYEKVW